MTTRARNLSGSFLFLSCLITVLLTGAEPCPAQSTSTMDEVVVTATRTPTERRHVGSSISVITREDIRNQDEQTVEELIRSAPGVHVARTGGAGQQVQVRIRGGEANHTQIRMDGIELNSGENGEYDLANFPVENIQRIEILRGSQSVLFGAEAVGGVINIITRKASEKTSGELSVSNGSFKTQRASGHAEFVYGDNRLTLDASHGENDGFSAANEERGNNEDDGFENDSYYAQFSRDVADRVTVTGFLRYTDAFVELDSNNGTGNDASNDFTRDMERMGKAEVTYEGSDGTHSHTIRGSFRNVDHVDENGATGRNEKEKLEYKVDWRLNSEALLTAGASTKESDGDAFQDDLRKTIENDAYFGQLQWNPNDEFSATVGARHDDNSQFGKETSERLSLSYWALDDLRFTGGYGTGFAPPTVNELTGFGGFQPSNEDLNPEESKQWELGVERVWYQGLLRANVTYFQNEIEDVIRFPSFTDPAQNLDRLEANGIEATIDWSPLDWTTVRAEYTYMESEEIQNDTEVGDGLRRPRNKGSLSVDVNWTDDFHTNVTTNYNGENEQQNFTKGTNPREEIDAYWVTDLSARYELSDHTTIRGRLDNVFDEDYEEVFGFGTAGISGYVGLTASF